MKSDANKLKLFISYSHEDENHINDFIKHIAPLKNNGLIDNWYDRKLYAGEELYEKIGNNLEEADIICLFVSADFLASGACIKEKENAIRLRNERKAIVIPVILNRCGWLDDSDMNSLLALPTDGKPVSSFDDKNDAWNTVYEELKPVITKEKKIRELKISDEFSSFLSDTELLTKAHSQKTSIKLDDIFVYPFLSKYNKQVEYDGKVNSKDLINTHYQYPKIILAGENQSGKTALCKKIYVELKNKYMVPVYLSDKSTLYYGKIEKRIYKALNEQYKVSDVNTIDRDKLVIIIDDFHYAKDKEKHIRALSSYNQIIVIVDGIFSLNFSNDTIVKSFSYFKIEEFSPSLRDKLIKKWARLSDGTNICRCDNTIYKKIDESTELVNVTLGKIFGSGIMPAHPFFILSVISTYEAYNTPLDQEITSQGYCYQALIYLYLRKHGVKNDEIDTYVNFLTEFSFFTFNEGKNELSHAEFNIFMNGYVDKFNLPIDKNVLLDKLSKSQILSEDSFGNYFFCYKYLYYFFVAKYLAENLNNQKETVNFIINNLHDDKNAYISIFISHHSKNDYILDEILLNAMMLFDKYHPATLTKDELHFFDKQKKLIVKAVLPPTDSTPEIERSKKLKAQDYLEENKTLAKEDEHDDILGVLAIDLRRSIKTVEVMGRIIKNRAGSLEKSRLEDMFKESMHVHFRILNQFFELIEHEDAQRTIIDFISNSIENYIDKQVEEQKRKGKSERKPTDAALKKLSESIFWNLNFFVIYGLINKIVHSVGSHKLTSIVEKVCDEENTPASFLVKHGILMWYNKNLQVDNIAKRMEKSDFSDIARKIIELQMVNHCYMHSVNYKDKQKIINKFNLPSTKLVKQQLII